MEALRDYKNEIRLIFFEGKSFTSKLIKWFTRGRYSHVGFNFGKVNVEAWANTNKSRLSRYFGIFGACWKYTDFYCHTPGTPYVILSKKVSKSIYEKYITIVDFIATSRMPYDMKEILKFVLRLKEKPDGKFVCSTGVAFVLHYLGVFPEEIEWYRQSPQDVYELALSLGFKEVEKGIVG